MYTENLTVKEMYASIKSTDFIAELFEKGLAMNNDRLAVSAMEELLLRGDSDLIVEALNKAFASGWIVKNSPLVALIARSLFENAGEVDPILQHYGKGLFREFLSPSEWIRAHAERYRKVPRCGAVTKARPWAAIHILPKKDLRQAMRDADAALAARAKRLRLANESLEEFIKNL